MPANFLYDWGDLRWCYGTHDAYANVYQAGAEANHYWPISVAISPPVAQSKLVTHTIVWHRRATKANARWLFHVDQATAEVMLVSWAHETVPYYARLISGYRALGTNYYTIVAQPGRKTVVDFEAPWEPSPSAKSFLERKESRRKGWQYPLSATFFRDVYASETATIEASTYGAAVWAPQPAWRDGQGWFHFNLELVDDDLLGSAIDTYRRAFAFPHLACPIEVRAGVLNSGATLERKHVLLYRDDRIGPELPHCNVPIEQLEQVLADQYYQGYWPVAIQPTAPGLGQCADVVFGWAGQPRAKPRVLTRCILGAQGQVLEHRGKPEEAYCPAAAATPRPLGQSPAPMEATEGQASLPQPAQPANVAPTGPSVPDLFGESWTMKALAGQATSDSGQGPMQASVGGGAPLTAYPFRAIDDYVIGMMRKYSVRAAQIAVAKDGQLKHAAAFTWAEEDYPITVPTTRMRIGSISKTITSFAMLRLVELLGQGSNPASHIDIFSTAGGNSVGALLNTTSLGWHGLSVAQLLCHLGKLNMDDFGHRFLYWPVASFLGVHQVPNPTAPFLDRADMVQYVQNYMPPTGFFSPAAPVPTTSVLHQALAGYSGFGYERVGDIIALRNGYGLSYEDWVRLFVFLKLGTARPRQGVETSEEAVLAAPDNGYAEETRYHHGLVELWSSAWVFDLDEDDQVQPHFYAAPAYRGHNYRLGLAGGQWSLAAVDYVRLLSSVDVPGALLDDPAHIMGLVETSYAKDGADSRSLGFVLTDVAKPGADQPSETEAGLGGGIAPKPLGGSAWNEKSAGGQVALSVSGHDSFPMPGDGWVPYEGSGPPEGPGIPPPGDAYRVAFHDGSWAGTAAFAFRRDDGVVAMVVYNANHPNLIGGTKPLKPMSDDLALADDEWPDYDLFPWVMDAVNW